MKKLVLLFFAALTIGANAQTTQGIDPTLVSDICVISYIHTDSLGFHWTLVHEKASSPDVAYYIFETATIANPTWVQQGFHTTVENSVFILDTIPFDSTTYFHIKSYDVAQNQIYENQAKPMFIHSVQESVTHTALTFSTYEGFIPSFYIIYRGNSPLTMAPYDSIAHTMGTAIQNYFDPEADSFSHYYQIGAVRGTTCDDNNASGYLALSGIAMSDIQLAGVVGIKEQQLLNGITLYPNPAQNTLNIGLGKILASDITVQLSNTLGQVISRMSFKNAQEKLSVDMGTLSTGIYFVQVQLNGATKTFRIVKN